MASALSWHSPSKEKKLLDNASLQTLPVGYHCSTHLHRTMELFICLQGKLTFSVLNLTQTIQPGEYVVIFSNTPHSAAVCEEDCTLLQIHFHSRVLLDMLPQVNQSVLSLPFILEIILGKRKYFKGQNTVFLQSCVEGIRAELSNPQEYSDDMLYFYMAQLSILLSRDMRLSASNRLYENPHLINATLYIDQHYMMLHCGDPISYTNLNTSYWQSHFYAYYTETAGTEADPAEDAEAPEVTITDEEDPAGDDSADNNTEADGDTLDQITELLGGLGTVTVTEDGILFTPDTEKWETQQTGTVTTCGGNLNVRTGAGLDNDAFTQLPDGAQVEVIGTEGEWVKVLLPEREGYVHSDYLTITDTGSFSLSLDGTDLSALLELFASGLSGGGGAALTPDGNLSLIDDLGGTSSGKQFITVETKGGNVFYLIIDRDDEGAQTVHFLNQVDEADLLALMEDGEAQEAPAVCTCTEKCQAGAVNTSCEVCAVNMAECAGAEPEPEPEPEPEAEKSGGMGALALVLALVVLGGGGAFAYIKFIRPKQASKVSADPDDYDFADEEEYINEDEPEPEEEMEDTK